MRHPLEGESHLLARSIYAPISSALVSERVCRRRDVMSRGVLAGVTGAAGDGESPPAAGMTQGGAAVPTALRSVRRLGALGVGQRLARPLIATVSRPALL